MPRVTEILELLKFLNTFSPAGLAALLALVLFYQSRNNKIRSESTASIEETLHFMRTNDLHELPEILATLQRIERENAASHATIIARLNGGTRA